VAFAKDMGAYFENGSELPLRFGQASLLPQHSREIGTALQRYRMLLTECGYECSQYTSLLILCLI